MLTIVCFCLTTFVIADLVGWEAVDPIACDVTCQPILAQGNGTYADLSPCLEASPAACQIDVIAHGVATGRSCLEDALMVGITCTTPEGFYALNASVEFDFGVSHLMKSSDGGCLIEVLERTADNLCDDEGSGVMNLFRASTTTTIRLKSPYIQIRVSSAECADTVWALHQLTLVGHVRGSRTIQTAAYVEDSRLNLSAGVIAMASLLVLFC